LNFCFGSCFGFLVVRASCLQPCCWRFETSKILVSFLWSFPTRAYQRQGYCWGSFASVACMLWGVSSTPGLHQWCQTKPARGQGNIPVESNHRSNSQNKRCLGPQSFLSSAKRPRAIALAGGL
jgi:hypothetical protein